MSSVTKRKRRDLTLSDKVKIIHEIESGKSQSSIVNDEQLPKSTVSVIWKNKDKILANYSSFSPSTKKIKKCHFPDVDQALLKWHDIQRERNIPINGPILLEQAKKFAIQLKADTFSGSLGWLERWKKRHSISFQIVSGEAGSVNDETIDSWLKNVWAVESEGYDYKDIFNADETGLFYKLLPNKTMSRKGKTCTGGKLSKERVTVLLCSNATGTDKLKPLVIGKYENPRCFKFVNKKSLPVQYYWNTNAWMTKDVSETFYYILYTFFM
jgi:DDE superfamily endonuclease/Tc5 transposase DNA-binding domain/CENP-B N-terminal DNA-binding domain